MTDSSLCQKFGWDVMLTPASAGKRLARLREVPEERSSRRHDLRLFQESELAAD